MERDDLSPHDKALVLELARRQREAAQEVDEVFRQYSGRFALSKQIVMGMLACGTALVAATGYILNLQSRLDYAFKEIANIRAILVERESVVKRVDEMWWMQQHGISNKEQYKARTGQPAPNSDTQ